MGNFGHSCRKPLNTRDLIQDVDLIQEHLDEQKPRKKLVVISSCEAELVGRCASSNGAAAVLCPLGLIYDDVCMKVTPEFYRLVFEEGRREDEALCRVMPRAQFLCGSAGFGRLQPVEGQPFVV